MTHISDERLAEIVGAGVPCVPIEPWEVAHVVQELRSLRSLSSLEASPSPVSEEMVEVVAKAISRLVPLEGSSAWIEPFGHDFPNGYSKKERQVIRQIAAATLAAKGGQ